MITKENLLAYHAAKRQHNGRFTCWVCGHALIPPATKKARHYYMISCISPMATESFIYLHEACMEEVAGENWLMET